MTIQKNGAGDRLHPDMAWDTAGSGERGGQREENDFDRGARRTGPAPSDERIADRRRAPNDGSPVFDNAGQDETPDPAHAIIPESYLPESVPDPDQAARLA